MATRRQGREWALQMLFQSDLNPGLDLEAAIPKFWRQQWTCQMEEDADKDQEGESEAAKAKSVEDRVAPPKIRLFTETLARGVLEHLPEIDARLKEHTLNWPMHRMGSVERNVLRSQSQPASRSLPAHSVMLGWKRVPTILSSRRL